MTPYEIVFLIALVSIIGIAIYWYYKRNFAKLIEALTALHDLNVKSFPMIQDLQLKTMIKLKISLLSMIIEFLKTKDANILRQIDPMIERVRNELEN